MTIEELEIKLTAKIDELDARLVNISNHKALYVPTKEDIEKSEESNRRNAQMELECKAVNMATHLEVAEYDKAMMKQEDTNE